MSWFVYIIHNQNGILYTGVTNNPPRRLKDHNGSNGASSRGAKATRAGRPWSFVYLEPVSSNNQALRREYEIKKLPRAKKLLLLQPVEHPAQICVGHPGILGQLRSRQFDDFCGHLLNETKA